MCSWKTLDAGEASLTGMMLLAVEGLNTCSYSVQRIRGTLRSSVPFLIFECTLDAMPAVESQISIFFF